jgi:hypothetical protein
MLPINIFFWEKVDNVDMPQKVPTLNKGFLCIASFEHGLGEILKQHNDKKWEPSITYIEF